MIDANSQFFAILTNVGMAKQANADALGIAWKITEMGVGDANGTEPSPSAAQTKLINEWRRKPLNQLKIDPANPAVIIAEQIIPADEGGKWIREIGLYDADGDLVAVANCAPSFKPLLSQGSGRTQIVRMNFIVTSTGNITLKIDPAIVLASRAYVDAAILEVLPKNKTPGEWTRVKTNDRGLVVSGDNPDTLAGMGIKDSYTKPEIESMIAQASALPVGTMVAFPVNKVAPGFLEVDGSVKSIAVYPDLAAFLGTAFNKGDEGAGNFRLPESRAEFLRGWDHGRGIDAARAIGSYQLDELKSHSHTIKLVQTTAAAGSGQGAPNGGGTINDASTVQFSGGTETRPRNLAVMWCIKAWNAPINQGNIDIAALVALAAQATEINQGTAKVATQAQVNAGTDDATIVTPKKLRFGFSVSWGVSGSVVFPTWLGGVVIQWVAANTGQIAAGSAETVTAPWPMAFPNACWHAIGST
ncbi:MAG: phage tail protein, partial [Pseudomonas sp.]